MSDAIRTRMGDGELVYMALGREKEQNMRALMVIPEENIAALGLAVEAELGRENRWILYFSLAIGLGVMAAALSLACTRCWIGERPVKMEAWEGPVVGAGAKACWKTIPRSARESRNGVIGSGYPANPTWSARSVSMVTRTTRRGVSDDVRQPASDDRTQKPAIRPRIIRKMLFLANRALPPWRLLRQLVIVGAIFQQAPGKDTSVAHQDD